MKSFHNIEKPNYFNYFTVYDTDGSVLTHGKYEIIYDNACASIT